MDLKTRIVIFAYLKNLKAPIQTHFLKHYPLQAGQLYPFRYGLPFHPERRFYQPGRHIGLARNGLVRGEYDLALSWIDKCERYNADYDEIYHFRMQIYDKTGNVDMAIDDALIYFDKSDDPDMVAVESICRKHLSYALARV